MRTLRIIAATVPAVLALMALAAPLLWRDLPLAAWSITQFFSFACHQDPARSFWIAGAPMAVCARCLGIYLGAAAGAWLRIARRQALRFLLAAAAVNALDVLTETTGLHGSWVDLRLASGFALGIAIGAVIVGAVLELKACNSAYVRDA